jgi:hypothetical protein
MAEIPPGWTVSGGCKEHRKQPILPSIVACRTRWAHGSANCAPARVVSGCTSQRATEMNSVGRQAHQYDVGKRSGSDRGLAQCGSSPLQRRPPRRPAADPRILPKSPIVGVCRMLRARAFAVRCAAIPRGSEVLLVRNRGCRRLAPRTPANRKYPSGVDRHCGGTRATTQTPYSTQCRVLSDASGAGVLRTEALRSRIMGKIRVRFRRLANGQLWSQFDWPRWRCRTSAPRLSDPTRTERRDSG